MQDAQVEITGESAKPYGSIEKQVKEGKVILTAYGVDNHTDIKKIIGPNGEEKQINYQEDKVININDTIESTNVDWKKLSNNFQKYIKETFFHAQSKKIRDITFLEDKTNIIVNIGWYWGPTNSSRMNQCFEEGYSILTNGNDSGNGLKIIKNARNEAEKINITKVLKDNEITSQDVNSGEISRSIINYNDEVEVWKKEILADGNEKDLIGYWKGEKGNKWIDLHNENDYNNNLFRNSIYRLSGTRSLTYETTQNGTYTFKLVDLCGNTTDLTVEVNEL